MMAPPQPERFIYLSEAGAPVGCVDRHDKSDGTKSFVQHRYERDAYVPGLNGATLPLYLLKELRPRVERGQSVFFVEGERKANALAAALRKGKVAAAVTTIAGGSNAKLTAAHFYQLRGGKDFVVVTDSDAPGRKAAKERAETIIAAFPDAKVRVVDLYPDRGDALDIHDWLDEGRSLDDLRVLIEAAPRVASAIAPPQAERDVKPPRVRTAHLVPASSITPIERPFTLYPYIPQGEATWFEGSTKSGKTMVAIDIASRVSHGRPFVNGKPIKRGCVAIITCEDDVDGTIVPRLIAADADLDRVSVLRVSDGEAECVPSFLTDLPTIEAALKAGNVSLVIVDGTFGMLGAKDANAYGDAYATMVPFVAMLRRVGCGAIIIRHVRKTDASALHRGIGSVGFGALARSTISIAIDRDDKARRIFAHAGSNLGESGATYTFRVEGVAIDGFERTVGRVVWGESVDLSADDAMMNRAPDDAAERDVAVEFLQSFLGTPTAASEVFEAAEKRRIARRTLQRAAKRCGVIIERRGFPSGSLWHPPLASEQSLTQKTPNPLTNAQSRHTYKPGATDEMATGGAPQTLTLQGANSRATVAPLLSGGATVGATGSDHGALLKASVPDADDIEVFE